MIGRTLLGHRRGNPRTPFVEENTFICVKPCLGIAGGVPPAPPLAFKARCGLGSWAWHRNREKVKAVVLVCLTVVIALWGVPHTPFLGRSSVTRTKTSAVQTHPPAPASGARSVIRALSQGSRSTAAKNTPPNLFFLLRIFFFYCFLLSFIFRKLLCNNKLINFYHGWIYRQSASGRRSKCSSR